MVELCLTILNYASTPTMVNHALTMVNHALTMADQTELRHTMVNHV